MTWLVDFVGYSMRNAPSVRTSIDVLHVLQVRGPGGTGHEEAQVALVWLAATA